MSNLDRAICALLGIEPIGWKLDGLLLPLEEIRKLQQQYPNNCWPLEAQYPALSTTGDGMVLLMEALAKADHGASVDNRGIGYVSGRVRVARSAPMALAMAAAAALGIEVADV